MNFFVKDEVEALGQWLQHYPFNLFCTLTFPDDFRSPCHMEDFQHVRRQIGRTLKYFGRRLEANICAIGVMVVTQAGLTHAHLLIWLDVNTECLPLDKYAKHFDNSWDYQSKTTVIRSRWNVSSYLSRQGHKHGTKLIEIFDHGPDYLKKIRQQGYAAEPNQS